MKNWLDAMKSLINLDLRLIGIDHLIIMKDDLHKFLQVLDGEISRRQSR